MEKGKWLWLRTELGAIVLLSVMMLWPAFCGAAPGAESQGQEYYKMMSTVEYSGQGQFRNQVETMVSLNKQYLSQDEIRYVIWSKDFDLSGTSVEMSEEPSGGEVSFIIDARNGQMSGAGKDIEFLQQIHNSCVRSVKRVTKQNVGKTWKQSFSLPSSAYSPGRELKFTMTAIELETKQYGRMVAVRALSEPFIVKVIRAKEGVKDVRSKACALYLFDSEINDIYLSISVFEAATNINSPKETFRHEVATYKTNAAGAAVDLDGLGKKFESFARKVGLKRESLKVEKQTPLPRWARVQVSRASQASTIGAAVACEGALNPVATVTIPAVQTMALQNAGRLVTAARMASVSSMLATSIPGMGAMKIAVAPAFMGVGAGTAAVVGGASVGTVAVAGGFDSNHRTSTTP